MTEWTTPVPSINAETAPFWEATKRHQYLLQRCRQCGSVQHYYRGFCATCWSDAVMDEVASGRGIVWSYSVIQRNRMPGFDRMLPYVVAVVELDEGVKICCRVELDDSASIRIGMPVKLQYIDATEEFSLPIARVVEP